jgi:hypothetical protein
LTILFVEPIAAEPALRAAYPDIFSVVRDEFKLYRPTPESDGTPSEVVAASSTGTGTECFGEILALGEDEAVCLIDLAPGGKVKTRIPTAMLAHLNPYVGMEFIWACQGANMQPEQFRPRSFAPPSPEEQEELKRLEQKFKENVERGNLFLAEER